MQSNKKVFLIRPFDDQYDELCDMVIKDTMSEIGYEVIDLKNKGHAGHIMNTVIKGIVESEICIALLTGLNWNVAYELGIRHAICKKGTIIICHESMRETVENRTLPFDISSLNIIYYNDIMRVVKEYKRVTADLKRFVEEASYPNVQPDNHVHGLYQNLPPNLILCYVHSQNDSNLQETVDDLNEKLQSEQARAAELNKENDVLKKKCADAENMLLQLQMQINNNKLQKNTDIKPLILFEKPPADKIFAPQSMHCIVKEDAFKECFSIGICAESDHKQSEMYLDLLYGNTAVFGVHASGKTMFMKLLLVHLHKQRLPECKKQVFILDFGGNIGNYSKLGMVSACFTQSNAEDVRRVFRTIPTLIKENERRLCSQHFVDLYGTPDGKDLTQIILIIDNLLAFLTDEHYQSYQEELLDLCQNGPSKGVTVLFTSPDTADSITPYLRTCTTKIAFDMPTDAYTEIFNIHITKNMKHPGHGLIENDHFVREFQSYLPFKNEKDELPKLIADTKYLRILTLSAFGDELNSENIAEYASVPLKDKPDKILIGLDYCNHDPVEIDLKLMHYLAIYGKNSSDKMNLLNLILLGFARKMRGCRFIMLDDGRNQLNTITHLLSSKGYDSMLCRKLSDFSDFLKTEGLLKESRSATGKSITVMQFDTIRIPTVFVLQSKQLFQGEGKGFINRFSSVSAESVDKPVWFLYSDVRKLGIDDRGVETELHNSLSAGFLLDDITEFINDRGARSVFGERDVKELRREYAHCEKGDGYFLDVEADKIHKLKFLKCEMPSDDVEYSILL